jgi:hypothetical protein
MFAIFKRNVNIIKKCSRIQKMLKGFKNAYGGLEKCSPLVVQNSVHEVQNNVNMIK